LVAEPLPEVGVLRAEVAGDQKVEQGATFVEVSQHEERVAERIWGICQSQIAAHLLGPLIGARAEQDSETAEAPASGYVANIKPRRAALLAMMVLAEHVGGWLARRYQAHFVICPSTDRTARACWQALRTLEPSEERVVVHGVRYRA
jgi:hypothetical protein